MWDFDERGWVRCPHWADTFPKRSVRIHMQCCAASTAEQRLTRRNKRARDMESRTRRREEALAAGRPIAPPMPRGPAVRVDERPTADREAVQAWRQAPCV